MQKTAVNRGINCITAVNRNFFQKISSWVVDTVALLEFVFSAAVDDICFFLLFVIEKKERLRILLRRCG